MTTAPAATHLVNLVWSERLRFDESGSDDNSNMLAALQDAKVRQCCGGLSITLNACQAMPWLESTQKCPASCQAVLSFAWSDVSKFRNSGGLQALLAAPEGSQGAA